MTSTVVSELRDSAQTRVHDGTVTYFWFSRSTQQPSTWLNGVLRAARSHFFLEYDMSAVGKDTRWITLCYLTPCCGAVPVQADQQNQCRDCGRLYATRTPTWSLTCSYGERTAMNAKDLQRLEEWFELMDYGPLDAALLTSHIRDVLASIIEQVPIVKVPEASPGTLNWNLSKILAEYPG